MIKSTLDVANVIENLQAAINCLKDANSQIAHFHAAQALKKMEEYHKGYEVTPPQFYPMKGGYG